MERWRRFRWGAFFSSQPALKVLTAVCVLSRHNPSFVRIMQLVLHLGGLEIIFPICGFGVIYAEAVPSCLARGQANRPEAL